MMRMICKMGDALNEWCGQSTARHMGSLLVIMFVITCTVYVLDQMLAAIIWGPIR